MLETGHAYNSSDCTSVKLMREEGLLGWRDCFSTDELCRENLHAAGLPMSVLDAGQSGHGVFSKISVANEIYRDKDSTPSSIRMADIPSTIAALTIRGITETASATG